METERTEGKTIRSQKRNSVNDGWAFLTPMVNSCKLHLTTVKPLVQERAQRMTDFQDIVKEKNMYTVQAMNHPNPENRLHACRGLVQTPLVPSFASISTDSPVHNLVPPACGAQSGLDTVSHATQDTRDKSRGPTHSAGNTYYRNALNFAKPTGGSGGYKYHTTPGFPYSRLPGDSFASSFKRIDLDRIRKICCLERVSKLNTLDLHDNQICRIENMSHLSELRVLNLAGNSISRVENLQGLDCLTELNLRHNCISVVTEVDRLPCLQRLFLSCNHITSFDQLACLGESRSLSELTLDGNPVALETWYKQAVLRCVLHLRQLDMKRITDEDRRMAGVQARKEEEKKKESHKQTIHKEKRRLAIRNAAQQWEGVRACLELPPTNGAKEEVSPENSPAHSPAQTNGLAQEPSPDEPRRVSPGSGPERPSGGTESRLRTNSRPNSPRDPKLVEAGSGSVQSLSLSDSHLAELDGDTLRLFGPGALEALERGWGVQTAGAVTVITFRYINFDAIVPTLPRIRVKFPNLSHLIFLETNISRLPQLAALTQVRRLDQLTIHPGGNPVVSLALWRSFVIYRLNHFNLQRINGQEVTMNDVIAAERVFGTLGHIAATETPRCRLLLLLEESRKRQLQFLLEGRGRRAGLSPEELRDNGKLLGEGLSRALFNYPSRDCSAESPEEGTVESSERAAMVEHYLQELVQRASDTNLKGEALHKLWPSMFAEMVRDCVLEMRDRAAFRQASLAKLSETK
ncbi:leucine-rich repeat-containing protein 49 isoform X4 [Epinephelus fuscoguttatus]|uniref:leucine-rich repeat-containing protein 49 isoform X4 n=1 Tax=Epinephelus fuscoguttatus TaxID=293821 RepID=UPI0020D1F491|nr:leucine-rich repeat-containing protein 49 isoform X4 [Epinephelus fuscoguttatus]